MKGIRMPVDVNDPYSIAESMNDTVADWLKKIEDNKFRIHYQDMEMAVMFLDQYVSVNKALVADVREKDKTINALLALIDKQ